MTHRVLCLSSLMLATALVAVVPVSAGILSDGEPKAAKGTTSERVSFIEGTQKGLAPNTTGTLLMKDRKVIVFHYGKSSLVIPYQSITSTELGPLRGHEEGPAYKFWNLGKRFMDKTRYLTIRYVDNGAPNKLVFEMPDRNANLTIAQIEIHQGKREGSVYDASSNDDLWWGDKYWRTSRNTDKWSKTTDAEAPKTSSAPDR